MSALDKAEWILGAVAGVSGGCPNLTFGMGGVNVFTSGRTEFERLACADLRSGTTVEVDGERQPDGRVLATEVEADFAAPGSVPIEADGIVSGLGGACPSLSFVVAGQHFVTDGATKFRDGFCAGMAKGIRVEAKGLLQVDGIVRAERVERE
jgi:hypothetical protein